MIAKRPPQAGGPVADLYYDDDGNPRPVWFLELVVKSKGGITGLRADYGGGDSTWKRYIAMAQAAAGMEIEWRTAEETWVFVHERDAERRAEILAEATIIMHENESEPPPATADMMAATETEMEHRLEDEDDPEQHPELGREGLPQIAYEEDLPRVFQGGMQGGAGQHPGETGTPDEWFSYYQQRTDVYEAIHEVRLKVVPGKSYAVIHPIGDVHIGDDECDFGKFYALLNWISLHEGHYVLGMGDYLEASTLGSVRKATISDQVLTLGRAMSITEMAFRCVADKIICLGEGNHEHAPKNDTGQDLSPLKPICEKLGCPRAPYDYPLIVHVGEQQYVIGVHHGAGAASTLGGIWNQVQRQLDNNEIQCAIMGHSHVKGAMERGVQGIVQHPEHGRVWDTKSRHMVRSGSFKRYQSGSYARRRNLPPAARGTVAIRLYATHDDIHYRV